MRDPLLATAALLAVVVVSGCEEDERLARLAQESAARQVRMAEETARLSRETAEATKHLVEADARARQELLAMQREMQAEQAVIGSQRDQLETERREIAGQRRWESLAAAAITNGAIVLACLAPLVLCCYLVWAVRGENEEALVSEVLIEELVSKKPKLLIPLVEKHQPDRVVVADDKPLALRAAARALRSYNPTTLTPEDLPSLLQV